MSWQASNMHIVPFDGALMVLEGPVSERSELLQIALKSTD